MTELTQQKLIELCLNLVQSMGYPDRLSRIVSAIQHCIGSDAAVLLLNQGEALKPLAQQGLTGDGLGRRFHIADHPRFQAICNTEQRLLCFPDDCGLPDPYDGMLLHHEGDLPVHACMGIPLRENEQLLGVLTLDSMQAGLFTQQSKSLLDMFAQLCSQHLLSALSLDQHEKRQRHFQSVVSELTEEARTKDGGELIGTSPAMQKLKQEIELVAKSDFAVLIEGETGVGKELVARTLHRLSPRAQAPLVYVNCAAIAENLIESELFGHVKGAFTGAHAFRAGKFSLANNGTIFLDEIGELSLSAQSKLLRALQNQEIQPVGRDSVEQIDVRVLAATNRELLKEVENGNFRADLYHRLTVYPLKVPALRERHGDVRLLSGFFAENVRRKLGLQQLLIASDAFEMLEQYLWPGNVRELEHTISRGALRASSQQALDSKITRIRAQHLDALAQVQNAAESPSSNTGEPVKSLIKSSDHSVIDVVSLKSATDDFQRTLIEALLIEERFNLAACARRLNVDRANLSRLAKRLGVSVKKSLD